MAGVVFAGADLTLAQAGDAPGWLYEVEPASSQDDPVAPGWEEGEPAPLAESTPVDPLPEPVWPSPGSSTLTLGGDGEAASVEDGLVVIAPATATAEGETVELQVLPREDTLAAGVSGFAFTVAGSGTSSEASITEVGGAEGLPAELRIDYSAFEYAYGAGYADRLKLVALPTCALETPRPEGCDAGGVALPSHVDRNTRELVALTGDLGSLVSSADGTEVVAASAPESEGVEEQASAEAEAAAADDSAVVLAVTSGVSGETGTFGATPLGPSADWSVAPGSGEFSWSYPMGVPAPPSGAAPEVGLSYSSGAVDGLVSTGNTQSPMSGVGWSEFGSSFIERRYESCEDTVGTNDLCWKSDNAIIQLNGTASEMVKVSENVWRLKSDPGWRVERLYGASNGDNAGEHWKVTTPDGVQYFFGLGSNPDTGAETGSTWWAPVLADHTGEPCRNADDTVGGCNQAWRWNLDRVVDPNGMTSTYFYSYGVNWYLSLGGWGSVDDDYVRAGRLERIEYGKPAGTGTGVRPAGRVVFEYQFRCGFLVESCPAPAPGSTAYHDVPVDLLCDADCLVTTPSFFTASRSTAVRTEVYSGGAWSGVDQWNLLHTFLENNDGDWKLYATGVQRVGLSQGSLLPLPDVNFMPVGMSNRIERTPEDGTATMGHFRVGTIVDEYGHEIRVTYGRPQPCSADSLPARWDEGGANCFMVRNAFMADVFHKYVVMQVDEVDATGGSPTMTTTYTYEGTPAWHYEDSELVSAREQSWSDWRGYGTVRIRQGSQDTRVRVFRGMQDDWMCPTNPAGCGVTGLAIYPPSVRRQSSVASITDGTQTFADSNWFAGLSLEEVNYGATGEVLQSFVYGYTAVPTHNASDPLDHGKWVGIGTETTKLRKPDGTFAQMRTTMTYNSHFQIATLLEEGWIPGTGDERCTRTSYAENPAAWMFAFPSGEVVVAGDCASTNELSRSETYYDGHNTSLTAAPTAGNPTMQRVQRDAARWITTSTMTYDPLGRLATVTDAAGHLTTTTHEATPSGGFPRTTTETSQVATSSGTQTFQTTTEWLVGRDARLRVTDLNGHVTSAAYDGLGRTVAMRLPTEQPSGQPRTTEYAYLIDAEKDAAPIVRARQLQSVDNGTPLYVDSWTIYDSLLRERQVQTLSPTSGKVVAIGTSYDNRGMVQDVTQPQAVTGTAGQGFVSVSWENRTRTTYDALGRVDAEIWLRGSAEAWRTTTTYTHDTTMVDPPRGGNVRSQVDGLGRTRSVEEHDGTAWRATTYTYDLADNLLTTTDPANNTITYTYNKLGWRETMVDPDAGSWRYDYDPAGNMTMVEDANDQQVHTVYDQLGRPTQRREDNPTTGPLLASWTYDATGEKGLLGESVRVTPQGNWTVDVTGYDERGRPDGMTWEVPAGVAGIGGESYTVGYGYDRADHQTSVEYPAVGGLPGETVRTEYTSYGLPNYMAGADEYVWSATYDDRGRPSQFGYGPRPNGQTWMAQQFTYDQDQRLARSQTATTAGIVADHQLSYDEVGNLTSRVTQLDAQSWRECFNYDDRQRLDAASTVTATATCANGTAGTGDQSYIEDYTYSVDGNLTHHTKDGVTQTYSYPTGTTPGPRHAPMTVGDGGATPDDTYQWDANGNLETRTVDGETEQLTWDAEQQLASISSPDGTTSFVYDTEGQRLMRSTPLGNTFYFAGHEVTATTDGTSVRAVRSYSFAGRLIATRSSDGVDYVATDQQGSVQATVASGGSIEATQTYEPYGDLREATGETDTDAGWIGQVHDPSSDLQYLNARYYDPALGTFISPDPIYDQGNPQTVNPYAYGLGNPTTNSDPSGLCAKAKCGKTITRIGKSSGPKYVKGASGTSRSYKAPHKKGGGAKYLKGSTVSAKYIKDVAALKSMKAANVDPGFWKALAKAGSAKNLQLIGLKTANADPGFWKALNTLGAAGLIKAAEKVIDMGRLAKATGRTPWIHGWGGNAGRVGGCDPGSFGLGAALDCLGDAAGTAGDWAHDRAEDAGDAAGRFVEAVECDISRSVSGPYGCSSSTASDYFEDAQGELVAGCTNGLIGAVPATALTFGALRAASERITLGSLLSGPFGIITLIAECSGGIVNNHLSVSSP